VREDDNEFSPYDALLELQQIQHQQAENMVKVSQWMIDVSRSTDNQQQQLASLFTMLNGYQKLFDIMDTRVKALETQYLKGINKLSPNLAQDAE
jgi:hypothetical protein